MKIGRPDRCRLPLLLLLAALTACQSPPPPVSGDWTLIGEVSGHTAAGSTRLRLTWRQAGERYSIRLRNPLGLMVARLDGDPGRVVLQLRGGRRLEGTSAEQLFLAEFGWRLPVKRLSDWLAGDLRGAKVVSLDASGRPGVALAGSWRLQVSGWRSIQGRLRPTRLQLEGEAASLELVISNWNGEAVRH